MATEIFGAVLKLDQVESSDEAIPWANSGEYGNMACLFTSSRVIVFCSEANNPGIVLEVQVLRDGGARR